MPSIPLPQIKLGKRQERSQMCEVNTNAGALKILEMPVGESCIIDEKRGAAFILDPDNQFLDKDGTWHQLLSEKSQYPLSLVDSIRRLNKEKDERDFNTLSNDIFKLRFKSAQVSQFEEAARSEAWDKFIILVSIVFGSFVLITAVIYLPKFLHGGG